MGLSNLPGKPRSASRPSRQPQMVRGTDPGTHKPNDLSEVKPSEFAKSRSPELAHMPALCAIEKQSFVYFSLANIYGNTQERWGHGENF